MNELTNPVAMPADRALALLNCGEITVEGRVARASNATMYCRVELDGLAAACVYKPISGERPLWDYPHGTLAEREYACYLLATATGWQLVPPTVLRAGPLGTGMVQLWIDDDESFDIVGAINDGGYHQLQRIALLDAVLNNSDRKVSHLLPVTGRQAGRLRPARAGAARLRRRPRGQPRRGEQAAHGAVAVGRRPDPGRGHRGADRAARRAGRRAREELATLLTTAEVAAVQRRVQRLLAKRKFPMPPTDWPAIPYPPY